MITVINWIKNLFSTRGGAAAGAGIAGFLAGGATIGVISHKITKGNVTIKMRNVATRRNLKSMNDKFIKMLGVISSNNSIATSFCESAVKDRSLFFREGGKQEENADQFENATIDAEFIKSYNRMVNAIDGRVDSEVLKVLDLFKNTILIDGLEYLVGKRFLQINSLDSRQDFSTRVERNPECQMDAAIASMILFLNVFLNLYEQFFKQLSSASSTSQVDGGDALSKTFLILIVVYINQSMPILQIGESEVLSSFRKVLDLDSARVKTLKELLLKVERNQADLVRTVSSHREKERVFALPEGLVWFGEVSKGYVFRFSQALTVKEYSDCEKSRVGRLTDSDSKHNVALIETFPYSQDQLYSDELLLPKKFLLHRMGEMKRDNKNSLEGVLQDVANLEANLLYSLTGLQTLANLLSGSIQRLVGRRGDKSVETVPMSLFLSLLNCCNLAMQEILTELLSNEYFEKWRTRHKRKCSLSEVPSSEKVQDVQLIGKEGNSETLTVHDAELCKLIEIANQLRGPVVKENIRVMIASLQYQKDLLRAFNKFKVSQVKKSLEESEASCSLGYRQVGDESRDVLDFSACLLSFEGPSYLVKSFRECWEKEKESSVHLNAQDSDGETALTLLEERIKEREKGLKELVTLLDRADKEMVNLSLNISHVAEVKKELLEGTLKPFPGKDAKFEAGKGYTFVQFKNPSRKRCFSLFFDKDKLRLGSHYKTIARELYSIFCFMRDLKLRRETESIFGAFSELCSDIASSQAVSPARSKDSPRASLTAQGCVRTYGDEGSFDFCPSDSPENPFVADEKSSKEFMSNRVSLSITQGYIRHPVAADGDCGYTAFQIERKEALSQLLTHIEPVKELLQPAIREALLTNKFYRYLIANNVIRFDVTHKTVIQQLERHLSMTAVYRLYLTYDVRDKHIDAGYAHPCVLQALAQIRGVSLRIWSLGRNAELNPHRGAGFDYFEHTPPYIKDPRPVDILFVNGNHFEFLESTGSGKRVSEGDMPVSTRGHSGKFDYFRSNPHELMGAGDGEPDSPGNPFVADEKSREEFMSNRVSLSITQGYIRHPVAADGDCGYTAFQIERKEALSQLLAHLEPVKELLQPAIREALLTDKFYRYLIANNVIRFDVTHKTVIQLLERYLSMTAVYRLYLTYDVRDKHIDAGYAHPCVLQALAQIRGVSLRIWSLGRNAELNPHRGAGFDYFEHTPPHIKDPRPVDILFVNGNHFEFLESTGSRKRVSEGDMPVCPRHYSGKLDYFHSNPHELMGAGDGEPDSPGDPIVTHEVSGLGNPFLEDSDEEEEFMAVLTSGMTSQEKALAILKEIVQGFNGIIRSLIGSHPSGLDRRENTLLYASLLRVIEKNRDPYIKVSLQATQSLISLAVKKDEIVSLSRAHSALDQIAELASRIASLSFKRSGEKVLRLAKMKDFSAKVRRSSLLQQVNDFDVSLSQSAVSSDATSGEGVVDRSKKSGHAMVQVSEKSAAMKKKQPVETELSIRLRKDLLQVDLSVNVIFYGTERKLSQSLTSWYGGGARKVSEAKVTLAQVKAMYILTSLGLSGSTTITFIGLFRDIIVTLNTHRNSKVKLGLSVTTSGKDFAGRMLAHQLAYPRHLILKDAQEICNTRKGRYDPEDDVERERRTDEAGFMSRYNLMSGVFERQLGILFSAHKEGSLSHKFLDLMSLFLREWGKLRYLLDYRADIDHSRVGEISTHFFASDHDDRFSSNQENPAVNALIEMGQRHQQAHAAEQNIDKAQGAS